MNEMSEWLKKAMLVRNPLAGRILLVATAFLYENQEPGAHEACLQQAFGCTPAELKAALEELRRSGFVEFHDRPRWMQ